MSLTYITICQLCGQKFNVPGFEDLLTTEIGLKKIGEVIENLSKHILQKHPKQFADTQVPGWMLSVSMAFFTGQTNVNRIVIPGIQLVGLLRLMYFKTDDPIALQMREWMRHQIHEQTRTRTATDTKIREQVHALGLHSEYDEPRVVALICQMRDIIEERGVFCPKQPGATVTDPNGQPKSLIIAPN